MIARSLSISVFVFLCINNAVSQPAPGGFCGTEQVHTRLMRDDVQYRNTFNAVQTGINARLSNPSNQRGGPAVYTIPVVVHIIHLGEPVGTGSNISDALIIAAIANVNSRYRNQVGTSVDTEIAFCLAVRDPNGNSTTGINRVNGSTIPNYASQGMAIDDTIGADELAVKNLSRWPNTEYYNIWVVQDIVGPTSGFSYYPTTYEGDGTVIEDIYMNGTNKTLTHEMGHAFNVNHTFEGDGNGSTCPSNANCSTDGDRICDTPPHKRGDCGSNNPCTAAGTWDNSRYNYMSYCGSTDRFTANQVTRMNAAVNAYPRSELLISLGCVPSTCATPCNDNIACTIDVCNNGACFYQSKNCNDNDACTIDACNSGLCYNQPMNCSDGNLCTTDTCIIGVCGNEPLDCRDGNPCTIDICDSGLCAYQSSCDDSIACTTDICLPQYHNIVIDYDALDEDSTLLAGGTYSRAQWKLNTRYIENDQRNSKRLKWAAVKYAWLRDESGNEYDYGDNIATLDSLDFYITHLNLTGTPDTIVITVYKYEGNDGVKLNNQDEIINSVLYSQSIVSSVSLTANLTNPEVLRVRPELLLPAGEPFVAAVHFYGSTSNIFNVTAGYGNRCGGSCKASPSVFYDNSYWMQIFWSGSNNNSGVNNIYYNCNSNGVQDPQICEGYDIQNYRFKAHLSLESLVDYECQHTDCNLTISGVIATTQSIPVSGVTVKLSGSEDQTFVTGIDGQYSFNVAQGGNYTITPSKNNDSIVTNGITTLDLLLTQSHVLAMQLLATPCKIIAADANNSSSISSLDIVISRGLILGNFPSYPGGRLWEFVKSAYVFPNPLNPFPFEKTRNYTNLSQSYTGQNFIGIKLGDVNESWNSGIH